MKKKQNAEKHRNTLPIFIAFGVVVCLLFSYFVVKNFIGNRTQSSVKSSVNKLSALFEAEGITGSSVINECRKDPSVKYGGKLRCSTDLNYAFIEADVSELDKRFEKLYKLIETQDIFELQSNLSENTERTQSGVLTSSLMKEKQSGVGCSVIFGHGVIGGLFEKEDTLKFTVSCAN